MGKRKERRLAAMSAAGRRVKLDIFAEPPGDLGGSTTGDEIGGESNSKNYAGLSELLSSSGQKPENPLLLLGQYSDDELDGESGEEQTDGVTEKPLIDLEDQVKETEIEVHEDTGVNPAKELTTGKVEHGKEENFSGSMDASCKGEETQVRENGTAEVGDLPKEMDSAEQTFVLGPSDDLTTGDKSSCWKMVLHDESNSYYYWNVVTGQTSWEVPDVFELGTETGFGEKIDAESDVKENALESECDPGMTDAVGYISVSEATKLNCGTQEFSDSGPNIEMPKGHTSGSLHARELGNNIDQKDVEESSFPVNLKSFRQLDGLLHEGNSKFAASGIHQSTKDGALRESISTLSSLLVKQAESLLRRLKSLEGSKGGDDNISKLKLEVEIRLFDMRSLFTSGSSLLPFWLHSESQLEQLEAAINSSSSPSNEVARVSKFKASPKPEGSVHDQIAVDSDVAKLVSHASADVDATDNATDCGSKLKEVNEHISNNPTFQNGVMSSFQRPPFENNAEQVTQGYHVEICAELSAKVVHSGEDTDMDVEMEVDDALPTGGTVTVDTEEQGFGIPPPPEDDWIPPPPPDDEPIPPPPPDEPPEPLFPVPPPEFQTVQAFPYAELYNLTYPECSLEYYAQPSTSSGYYVDGDRGQVGAPQPPLYYAAPPNSYPPVSVVVSSVEPITYHALQEGSVPSATVVNGIEASVLQSVSGHGSITSDETRDVEGVNEVGFTPLPASEVIASVTGGDGVPAFVDVPFVPVSALAPATSSLIDEPPSASTSGVTGTIPSAEGVPKVQTKVSRNKKRTVSVVATLRSNKKVSGLVDKWKAAKEELHENEEDEPENAYELLEKKKQREIEEWRAQQISTGEAKDNANFQPLGGDWRERVKRKRAKMASAAEETPSEVSNDGSLQHPDLVELSRDLPSGWQAYWDEASKQVYYGNFTTSETTWIRPTA